ncbi:FG-GAP repeat protein [Actinoplanes sp. NPDC049316]|uniref:FG-GAP and VCBS repeat-containing protein n=1 Tax=Actinoplanes sp. NPDC049316 TaxID=3154727 RepID=UPI003431AC7C
MRRFVVAALVAPFLVLPVSSAASAACARVPSDFDGDGYGDLAIGAPRTYQPVGDINWQGVVDVSYGSATGLGKGRRSVGFDGRAPGIPKNRFGGSARLGEALASGYFNGDCYADLAISAASASDMLVLYGSASGLTTTNSAGFDRTAIQPGGAYGSGFSLDLESGDFNGDGFDDVAAGAPWTGDNHGAFGVLYGSSTGITDAGAQWIDQDSPGVPGVAEPGDVFGWNLAAGDFNGDGRSDLAVGARGEGIGTHYDAGGVVVFSGTSAGLVTANSTWWDQDSPGVPGAVETLDSFGAALAAGDTDGDGRAELIVGVPSESIGAKSGAGMVHVFRGTASGLAAGPAFDQDNPQIPGDAENGDYFGDALTLADLNRDGKRDLVIGVRSETAGSADYTGAVNVLYSTATGPSAAGAVYIDQNSPGVPGANEDGDGFGSSLSRVINAYGGEAVVVGAPWEKVTYTDEGAVTVLPSAPKGAARPAGVFISGADFPRGASTDSAFGTGLS